MKATSSDRANLQRQHKRSRALLELLGLSIVLLLIVMQIDFTSWHVFFAGLSTPAVAIIGSISGVGVFLFAFWYVRVRSR